ncbi:MAG TPA: ParB/RepB/Spo0J family partition protein [Bryobacteraceae bacterium]|nr:ParB/RepB/Spo0J family partition protein [Bryobacteraceae bacterium]
MNKTLDQNPRKALGKGLSALLPSRGAAPARASIAMPASAAPARGLPEHFENFQSLPLDQIVPGNEQPRANFDPEKLAELADSIRANGIIQPITVCPDGNGRYRIIAGERRWRASQLAGNTTIPALIRTADEHERLELALIENLQREDLNPIEIATAFQRLIDEHRLSHEQIAQRTGKDRSTVTNFLRLLRSSPFVRSALIAGSITMGHARALLNLPTEEAQDKFCRDIVAKQFSVRQTESLVKNFMAGPKPVATKAADEPAEDPNVRAALAEMEAALGTRVRLTRKSNGAGRLEVEFYSADDLDRIYGVIVKQ